MSMLIRCVAFGHLLNVAFYADATGSLKQSDIVSKFNKVGPFSNSQHEGDNTCMQAIADVRRETAEEMSAMRQLLTDAISTGRIQTRKLK
jgi:hypothetical protein